MAVKWTWVTSMSLSDKAGIVIELGLFVGYIEPDSLGLLLLEYEVHRKAECGAILQLHIIAGLACVRLDARRQIVGRHDFKVRVELVAGEQGYIGCQGRQAVSEQCE